MQLNLFRKDRYIFVRKVVIKITKHRVKGIIGRLLRINLTEHKVLKESLNPQLFADFLGGRGLGARILYEEVKPRIEALNSENKLIFMTGPLEGTLTPCANKITVSFKSPLTESYSVSNCGGHFAVELKFAGYDGIIIEGKSEAPVYIMINDNDVEIKSASHLWGRSTHVTQETIKEELNDEDVEIACIGPAGENLISFSCIQADYHREFGRGGAGAVMGAKNLKAIVLKGSGYVEVANPKVLEEITHKTYKILKKSAKVQARRMYGTPELVKIIGDLGFLPTENFSRGVFEGAKELEELITSRDKVVADRSCFSCPIACGKVTCVREGPYKGTIIEGPEYESIGLLGPNCGIKDMDAIIKATSICDLYGMDTISTGNVVGFAMECYEKGLIDKNDTDGVELNFGNVNGYISIINKIAKREGIGNILAEGVKKASKKLGGEDYAIHVKGLELPAYDPRGSKGLALTYATAARGGCHMKGNTVGLEIAKGNRLITNKKAILVKETQQIMAILDSIAICSTIRFALDIGSILKIYSAVTGLSIEENLGMKLGERILNMERLFNVREGFDKKADLLPKRFSSQPMPDGATQGQIVELQTMLDEYYKLMGWDRKGRPTKRKIKELGLFSII